MGESERDSFIGTEGYVLTFALWGTIIGGISGVVKQTKKIEINANPERWANFRATLKNSGF